MTIDTSSRPIVLAAGGTGGHIFPAEALAEELRERGHSVVLVTDKRFSDYNSSGYKGVISQIPIHYIHAGTMSGGFFSKLCAGFGIILGIMQARRLLKELKPQAVVGFGGYPSFPTMMAAAKMGLNTVIHEQNSVLGKANRMLANKVRRIALTYEDTQRLPKECAGKSSVTGNPVRSALRSLHHMPYPEVSEDSMLNILVIGGSQGATVFSSIVPDAIRALPEPLRARIRIDQQCRAADLDKVREAYKQMNVNANLASFFPDVATRMASSHLVICRAGASTVAEVATAGRPAIFVPYPDATDNHQFFNAKLLEEVGGAWLMPQDGFTVDALSARLESFLNLPGALSKAASLIRKVGRADAAPALAEIVLGISDRNTATPSSPKAAAPATEPVMTKEGAA